MKKWKDSTVVRKLIVSGYCIFSIFAVCGNWSSSGVLIKDLSIFLGTPEDVFGNYFVLRSLGMLVGSLLVGQLCDIFGKLKKIIFILSNGGMAISVFLVPLFPYFWIHMLLGFMAGFCDGSITSISALFMQIMWKRKANPFLQLLFFSFSFSGFVFPFVLSQIFYFNLSAIWNVRIGFWFNTILLLIPCTLFFIPIKNVLMVESEKEESEKKKKKNGGILNRLVVGWKKMKWSRIIFVISDALCQIFFCALEGMFQSLVFLFSVTIGVDKSTAAFVASLFYLSQIVTKFLSIFFAMVLKPFHILCICAMGVVLISYLFLINFSFPMIVITTIFLSIFTSPIEGSLYVVPLKFNIVLSGVETSLLCSGCSIGLMSPTLVGYLMKVENNWFVYSTMGFAFLYCFFVILMYFTGLLHDCLERRRMEKKVNNILNKEKEIF